MQKLNSMQSLGRPHLPLEFWVGLTLLVSLFFILLLPVLSEGTLFHTDECLTAERSREMLLLDDYTTVYLNFKPNFNKPPLQYILTTLSIRSIKDPELRVRIWSLLYATGSLILTALLYLQVRSTSTAWSEALWAAIALASYGYFIDNARIALLDMGLLFFILLVLISVFKAHQAPSYWLLAGLAAGLGSWQKNTIPLFILMGLVLMSLASQEIRSNSKHRLWIILALILSIILSITWPILQWMRHPEAYLAMLRYEGSRLIFEKESGVEEVISRLSYLKWILEKWLVFGMIAMLSLPIILMLPRLRAEKKLRMLAFTAFIYLISLSLFAVWHKYYMLPILPLLSICGVYLIFDFFKNHRRWAHVAILLILIPVLVMSAFHIQRPTKDHTHSIECAREAMQSLKLNEAYCLIGKSNDLQSLFWHQIAYYLDQPKPLVSYRFDTMKHLPSGTFLRGVLHESMEKKLKAWTEESRVLNRRGDYLVFEGRRNDFEVP